MKNRLIFCICLVFPGMAMGQVHKGQFSFSHLTSPPAHYQAEYLFDTSTNPAAWQKVTKGLHVSFGSTDELYFRREVPSLNTETTSWEATGWKGERLNAVVLVWSADTIEQIRFLLKDLVNAKGQTVSKSNCKVRMIRYVASNYPYGAKDVTCDKSPYKDLYLMPDRFEQFERFEVPGGSVRPVWLSWDIPSTIQAGEYTGSVEVKADGYTEMLQLKIVVQNQTLPRPQNWKHRLDLWQNPWVVAWNNNLVPWSAEHKLLLKKHLRLYADAGGKYITTYAVHSPWADNSYSIEGGMIDWVKRKDGSWSFDYSIFDDYIQLAMSVGIKDAITIYTPVPWGFRFSYKDESTGLYKHESWAPGSAEFTTRWKLFLTDLRKHLLQKGWFHKTYIGINENPLEQTMAAIKMIREHDSKWKITYAGDWHKELENLLDDYCFLIGKESAVDVVERRAAKGFTTTYYNCCNPPVPNNFVFSPPIEGRWLGWYTTAHKYDGYLRWAYDAWPADPMRDARHTLWPAGDCFLVYPGANSSIRFEKLREGIVDFEKLRILREKVSMSGNKNIRLLAKLLEDHLQVFLAEKEFESGKITTDVNKGRKLVAELSDQLAGQIKKQKE